MYENLLVGALGGVAYGVWKYGNRVFKGREGSQPKEPFAPVKFIRTVLIGAVIGGGAGWFGMPLEFAFNYSVSLPFYITVTGFVEDVFKRIYNRIIKK